MPTAGAVERDPGLDTPVAGVPATRAVVLDGVPRGGGEAGREASARVPATVC